MKNVLTIGLALVGLAGAAMPAQAGFDDVRREFENHCSVHGLSASCSISKTKNIDLPDTIVPAGKTTSHGPVWGDECGPFAVDIPMPGGKVFCVADYTSYMFKNAHPSYIVDGGIGQVCETKTATVTIFPKFKITYGKSATPGACVR